MIIKKNSQKFREVRKKISEPAVKEEMPVSSDTDLSEETTLEQEEKEEENVPNPEENLPKEPEIDLFDIENIDFNQRQERRRGSRRRGATRIMRSATSARPTGFFPSRTPISVQLILLLKTLYSHFSPSIQETWVNSRKSLMKRIFPMIRS